MGIFSNRIFREELRPGDHIYAYRRWHRYSHHDIHSNINATNDPKSSSSSRESPCGKCRHDPNSKRGKGTCSIECCYSNEETVCLATEIFNKDKVHGKGFGDYDLLDNNCENFTSYCKTGKSVSEQALKAMSIASASSRTDTPSSYTSKTTMVLSLFSSKSF
ncbi:hypothetical protein PRUPE_6G175600 [Prunus persica]|uniref:LRAT domain-containing protein n=1 Tax=Prunus persica TaxID=3760 RepID=A0A251NRY1_PRUPE|nr:hypothetical protein PRUPE_6G175600 [Prunus persica]